MTRPAPSPIRAKSPLRMVREFAPDPAAMLEAVRFALAARPVAPLPEPDVSEAAAREGQET